MGIFEIMGSTAESLRRNAPDVTPVKKACRTFYDYGSAACAKIDRAARAVAVQMPDKRTIGLYASKLAKNAGQESYKMIPAESLRRNAPDVTPVKKACRTSYDYGSAACAKIDRAARAVAVQMPDKRTIGLYALKLAKNAGHYAVQESYKMIPGGVAFSKIITSTLNDVRQENLKVEKMQAAEDIHPTGHRISRL